MKTIAIWLTSDLGVDNIVLPFPVLYETLDTRFCNRKEWVISLSLLLKFKY
jgi:hypothetical protein